MTYEIKGDAIMANIIEPEELAMLKRTLDLDLLRYLFLQLIDSLEVEHERNNCQDRKLEALTQRINYIESQQRENVERLEFLEGEFPHLRYRADRSIELEFLENPYSPDGDPRCNS